jgi:hypothetical protein
MQERGLYTVELSCGLPATDVHLGPAEVDRRPFEITKLSGPEAVPVCERAKLMTTGSP